jgi:hypothetical protein
LLVPGMTSAQTQPLVVTIKEVEDLTTFPDHFDIASDPDFFIRTTAFLSTGAVSLESPIVDDDGHFMPSNWVFRFNVPVTQRFVEVSLFLRDHDPDPEADAIADISPVEGDNSVEFTVDMATGCYTGQVATPTDCSQGGGEGDDPARVCFSADAGDRTDTDGDGLLDAWEAYGADVNRSCTIEPDEDLPARGASVTQRDVFVRIDYMDCAVAAGDCPGGDLHSHRPDDRAIQAVRDAFAAEDIDLHVDIRNSLRHQWFLQIPGLCINNPATCDANFDTVKAGNFLPAELRDVYHYAIFGHMQDPGSNSSGCAELPGNDLIVTLGAFEGKTGSVQQQAGTFMHELGHNLNLRHGGDVNRTFVPNYQSIMNYAYQLGGLPPTDPDGSGPLSGRLDFSSGGLSAIPDERSIDETLGLGATTDGITFFCPDNHPCQSPLPATTVETRTIPPASVTNGSIPWRCEADGFTPQVVSANLDGDWFETAKVCFGPFALATTGQVCATDADCGGAVGPTCSVTSPRGPSGCATSGQDGCFNTGETDGQCFMGSSAGCNDLHDFDDWGALQLAFQGTPNAADGVHLAPGGVIEPELDFDTYSRSLASDLELAGSASPTPILTGTDVTFTTSAVNVGPSGAESVTMSQTLPTPVTFRSCQASGGASCGGTATVPTASWSSIGSTLGQQLAVTAAVRCEVPDGTAVTSNGLVTTTSIEKDLGNNMAAATAIASNPPPVISNVSVRTPVLWPPSHGLVTEVVDYEVTDNCGTPVCRLEVRSNEPINGLGDGDAAPDWRVLDDHRVRLRAERSGTGTGRVYTISVICSDSGGGSSNAEATVTVPHSLN